MKLAPGARLGPYEIRGALGAGGMGEVYRAWDPRLAREVALKVITEGRGDDPDRVRRFEQEARAVAAINDPRILAVYDVGVEDGTPYVVFELLEGQTLRARLAAGRLPLSKAVRYAVQIAEGLAAAHARGVVHRDLKPANIFVTAQGQAKVLDFGLAKLTQLDAAAAVSGAETRTATESGVVLGTAGYLSPEQARGQQADARSDVFALGAVLYEMIAGQPAFDGATSADRLSAVLHSDPLRLAPLTSEHVPAGLEQIVRRCLDKDPGERFHSARDVAYALEATTAEAAPSTPRAASSPWAARLALAVGAAGIAAGLYAVLVPRAPEAAAPLAIRQLTWAKGIVTGARFAPGDERTIVYSASWDGRPNEIFATSPDGPESRSLGLPAAKLLGVSSRSELAILLTRKDEVGDPLLGTLARVPLGGGVPRPVLDDVEDANWSPDGEELAVVRWTGGVRQLEYPIGKILMRLPSYGNSHSMRVSPKGDRVAIEFEGRLVVVDRSGAQQSLGSAPVQTGLAWSPEGDAVLATMGPSAATRGLWRLGLDGSRRQVYAGPGVYVLHDVSATGAVLLHHGFERVSVRARAPGQASERELAVTAGGAVDIARDGSAVLIVTEHDVSLFSPLDGSSRLLLRSPRQSPAFGPARLSPDGRWLIDGIVGPGNVVRLAPIGPGEPRPLPLGDLRDVLGAFLDDRRVYWQARQGTAQGPRRGFVQELATGAIRPVTPPNVQPLWSPEVNGALLGRRDDGVVVWCPVAGGEPRPTRARVTGPEVSLQTTADGRYTFVNAGGIPMRVDRIDLQTGERTPWRMLGPPDISGVAYIESSVPMTFDGTGYAYTYLRVLQDLFLIDGLR